MKKRKLLVGLLSIFMLTGALGIAGCSGADGKDGINGINGINGKDGIDGKSAYEIWLDLGHTGTEEDFLEWLKGDSVVADHDGTEGLEFYPLNDTECAVSVGTAQLLKEIVIPSKYKNYTVTTINSSSIGGGFASCANLEKITLPDTITTIGSSAFEYCSSLTSVNIPDGVTSIGNTAFYNCSSLMRIEIPDSVISIGNRAFNGCSSVTSVEIGVGVTSIGYDAFGGCSGLEKITLPFVGAKASVTTSDTYQYPFGYIFGTSSYTGGTATNQYYYNFSTSSYTSSTYYIPASLKEVTIAGGYIPYGAFEGCSNLTSVEIGAGVTNIDDYAFYGCSSLTSVEIGAGVTRIGYRAFHNCSSLASVYITDVAAWCNILGLNNLMTYGSSSKNLYLNNELVTELVIPDSATGIGDYAFYGCSSLTSVVIPDSATSIGEYAFYSCSSLKSVVMGGGVTSIGDYAFAWCRNLKSVTIPDNVTSIGNSAFYYCSSLTIYCEASSKPSGWNSSWNISNRPVVWGYQG